MLERLKNYLISTPKFSLKSDYEMFVKQHRADIKDLIEEYEKLKLENRELKEKLEKYRGRWEE